MVMRILLKKRSSDGIEYGLIYGVITIIALIAARFLPIGSMLFPCPFFAITGIPCPTCGTTRSILHLSSGHILSALGMNPLMTLLVFFLLLWFIFSIISIAMSLPRPWIVLSPTEGTVVRILIVLLLLLNWAYLIIHLKP